VKDRPHNDRRWRRLRAAKLAADPFCGYCPPGALTAATEVDHIVPVSKGGPMWDWDNLKSSCKPCHSKKTCYVDVRGRDHVPVKGVDPRSGLPLDPAHWWAKG